MAAKLRRLFTAAVSPGLPPARNPSFRITSSADVTDLHFQGVPRPVRLICCADLLSEARAFFSTWPFREEGPSDVNPFLTIRRVADGGYRLESFLHTCGNDATGAAHGDAPRDVGPDAGAPESRREASPACALCSLSIDLVTAFCAAAPSLFCLHGAAVRLVTAGAEDAGGGEGPKDTGAVLMFGANRAGKSVLTARLMASGHIGCGDDMIGMTEEGEIVSFGIPPRLRLPLPRSERLRVLARTYRGTSDARYRYLQSGMPLLAPFGSRSGVNHALVLERTSGARPEFVPLSQDEGLARILPRWIMRQGTAETVFRRAERLAARIPVFLFRYSDLDEAAAFLGAGAASRSGWRCAGSGTEGTSGNRPENGRPCPPARGNRGPSPVICGPDKGRDKGSDRQRGKDAAGEKGGTHADRIERVRYKRADGVRSFARDGSLFLVDGSSDAIFHLNASGQAVWLLLDAPLDEEEAVALLREAFRSVPEARIVRDVKLLFRGLLRAGLVVPAGEAGR